MCVPMLKHKVVQIQCEHLLSSVFWEVCLGVTLPLHLCLMHNTVYAFCVCHENLFDSGSYVVMYP